METVHTAYTCSLDHPGIEKHKNTYRMDTEQQAEKRLKVNKLHVVEVFV